jgi:hypothetical protein
MNFLFLQYFRKHVDKIMIFFIFLVISKKVEKIMNFLLLQYFHIISKNYNFF